MKKLTFAQMTALLHAAKQASVTLNRPALDAAVQKLEDGIVQYVNAQERKEARTHDTH